VGVGCGGLRWGVFVVVVVGVVGVVVVVVVVGLCCSGCCLGWFEQKVK
jgi:hypothetical protein